MMKMIRWEQDLIEYKRDPTIPPYLLIIHNRPPSSVAQLSDMSLAKQG